jgi:hypothetical protein
VSIHLDSKSVTQGNSDDLNRIFDQLKQRGFLYAVFPYLPEPERGGIDVIKAFAEKLNRAGEKCRAAGMTFCYHNHAFEFATEKGATLFQVMLDNTDKKLVGIELDVFWVSVAGGDPVEMIQKQGVGASNGVQRSRQRGGGLAEGAARGGCCEGGALLRGAGPDSGRSGGQPAAELRLCVQVDLLSGKSL